MGQSHRGERAWAGITSHRLRHTFAAELREGGADLQTISDLLGHAQLDTTRIYAKARPDWMRQQIAAHHSGWQRGKNESKKNTREILAEMSHRVQRLLEGEAAEANGGKVQNRADLQVLAEGIYVIGQRTPDRASKRGCTGQEDCGCKNCTARRRREAREKERRKLGEIRAAMKARDARMREQEAAGTGNERPKSWGENREALNERERIRQGEKATPGQVLDAASDNRA